MSTTRTIAFFGATGDCAGYCLAACLRNEYTCTALARSPEKLQVSLAAKGISPEIQSQFLTITQGDIRDIEAVRTVLHPTTNSKTKTTTTTQPTTPNQEVVVDLIISGIGPTAFYLHPNPLAPIGIQDSAICWDASKTILAALLPNTPNTAPSHSKPLLINISTTGISPPGLPRDIPFLYIPLYRWLLHHPHVDKAGMEKNLRNLMTDPGVKEEERGIRGFVNVKPTLLTGGEGKGWEKIRAGVETEPAIGWFVARRDVGEWVFERFVRREVEEGWVGRGVSLAN